MDKRNNLLIVDGTNTFIRTFVKVPTMGAGGNYVGGITGFLKCLRHFINAVEASKVVVVFDGSGGSKRRKKMYGEYKDGRSPSRTNRPFDQDPEQEYKNKTYQALRLNQYLGMLPVIRFEIDDIEADDVIAYVAQYATDYNVFIASSDSDFEQLVNDRIKIYKPTKHTVFDIESCVNSYNIYPFNLALAKSFVGDDSDNIKGMKGIGYKTLVKLLPIFSENRQLTFKDIKEYIGGQENKDKYNNFYYKMFDAEQNYKLIQLNESIISVVNQRKIRNKLEERLNINMTGIRLNLRKDGINEFQEKFFLSFKSLLFI